ncbi:hypothetical protein NDU88_004131 [Pleurodeles waltl]|uniref:Uncharacterized protein n=1 Tax=Pleurodeles waltl TaxID=8319 RepID=A0AAV7QF77_PLEWA|nr:hypothetical protein NDU88_004131 [Pleurodeles waltl]
MTPPNGVCRVAFAARKTACLVAWATEMPETSLGNADILVPDRPKRVDGLPGGTYMDDKEDAEGTGREEEGERTEDEERKTNDDGSKNGNSAVLKKAADQRGTEENGDTRSDRHVPGGTWLTNVRPF